MLTFYKYHGTGNDFILIDNRHKILSHDSTALYRHICDRHLGVGGDGLMLLENSKDYAFEMFYYNSDGVSSSMCGNGGRCIVAFAKRLGIVSESCDFLAIDGPHHAKISAENLVKLNMISSARPIKNGNNYIIDTGSPHYVTFKEKVSDTDVYSEGRDIRRSPNFLSEGINVNFVEKISGSEALVRTYERGVENETLSCGTGVTAVALVLADQENETGFLEKTLRTPGGLLKVSFHRTEKGEVQNLFLEGPTQFVFEGVWPVKP